MLLYIMKVNLKRRFRSKLEKKILKDYLVDQKLDIEQVIDDYYNYIYAVVKNSVNITITDEDIEEIISDVFMALWRNNARLNNTIEIKSYLIGIAKNTIKNRYRKMNINISISDYEEKLISKYDLEKDIESIEQEREIINILKSLKEIEYKVFIFYYYDSKSIKEIANILNISISNVKVTLYRVRKILRKKLKDGGYSYGE